MEPIAACLEAFDLLLAYLYWMSTDQDFELSNIKENSLSGK